MSMLKLSEDERILFVEIGYHIARVMWENLSQSDASYDAEMWDRAESVYERGCSIMQQLGVFECNRPSNYKFSMPLAKVREYLQNIEPEMTYSLDEMIGNFLWAVSDYQGEVSNENEVFEVPGRLQQAMWAFAKLGYATREPGGFKWTSKIAPIMVSEYLWSNDEESWNTLEKQEAAKLTEKVWSAIPFWYKHYLARWIVGKSHADLFVYLFRRWDGRHFHLFEIPKKRRDRPLPRGYEVAAQKIGERLLDIRVKHPF